MINLFSKSNFLKYLVPFFFVLLTLIIFFAYNLSNNNSQPLSIPIENENYSSNNENSSSWIDQLIKNEEENEVSSPPASLIKCSYKGNFVYYLPARCCDIPSIVYNEDGSTLCSPDGGVTGNGDGKCTDFFELKNNCVVIWADARK